MVTRKCPWTILFWAPSLLERSFKSPNVDFPFNPGIFSTFNALVGSAKVAMAEGRDLSPLLRRGQVEDKR